MPPRGSSPFGRIALLICLPSLLLGITAYRPAEVVPPRAAAPLPLTQSAPSCGEERWSIKTGTDGDANSINLTAVTPTTIQAMIGLPAPTTWNDSVPRIKPTESTIWVIDATLTGFKQETDSDYHLVISDGKETMIAEIPDPHCVGANSPFLPGISKARAAFDSKLVASGKAVSESTFQVIKGGVPVRITGPGFFDKLHGQRGLAKNGIEIHPVLDIVFNPGPAGQPAAPDNAPVLVNTVTNSETVWDYTMLSANSAEDLTTQLAAHGDEGWELVSVVLDDKQPNRYVAFLKRLH